MFRLFIMLCLSMSGYITLGQLVHSGYITSEKKGIPGATLKIGNTGAITNADGYYVLKSSSINSIVEIRAMGFNTLNLTFGELAQQQSMELQPNELGLEEVVVTGTMAPTMVKDSPVKVDVFTNDYMNTFLPAASTGVIESISLVNGVQEVVACGVCFTNSISVNGLPGPYTAVLMDGSPIYGNLAAVYGLNGIPSMIIDRIEVIKGPSSTLYGSEAVAGVINIITKNPETQPAFSMDIMGTTHSEVFGNLALAPTIGKHKGFVGLNYAYVNGFDDENGDGFGDNINLDRISLFSKWSIARKDKKKFSIAAKYLYEDRRNGVEEFLNGRNYRRLRGSTQTYGESIYTNRLEVFGTYELPYLSNVKFDYSASTHKQNSFYGSDFYKASQQILFGNLVWNQTLGDHSMLTGLTSRYQAYDDNTVATQYQTANHQFIPGVFVQDEWSPSRMFTVLGGARIDHYSEHGVIVAPRLNTKWRPGNWTTLRTNFGTGFRIVNLFTEDHAFVTGQREVIIAEELNPEESYNFTFNLNHVYAFWQSQGMIDVDLFYTYFTNKITPNYDNQTQIVYANSNGHAISRGIGLNVQQQIDKRLSLNLGTTVQQVFEVQDGSQEDIEFSPRWSGVLTANYDVKRLELSLAYTASFTGSMTLPEVFDLDPSGEIAATPRPTTSAPYSIHNLQVTKGLKSNVSIYTGIQNLFNFIQPWSPLVGFNDPGSSAGFSDNFDTSYAYAPIHGIEVYLGIKWDLN